MATIYVTSSYVIALRDFVSFVQFYKREKHPWRSVTFSIVAGFRLNVTLLHGCFSRFFRLQMVKNGAMHHT